MIKDGKKCNWLMDGIWLPAICNSCKKGKQDRAPFIKFGSEKMDEIRLSQRCRITRDFNSQSSSKHVSRLLFRFSSRKDENENVFKHGTDSRCINCKSIRSSSSKRSWPNFPINVSLMRMLPNIFSLSSWSFSVTYSPFRI